MLQIIKNKIIKYRIENKFIMNLDFHLWYFRTREKRKAFNDLNISIQSTSQTIDAIIKNKKSIARFGDGELRLILNKGKIVFQNENQQLSNRLQEVLQSNLPNLIVALPTSFKTTSNLKLKVKYFWVEFLNLYSSDFSKFLIPNKVYGNSFISRFYIDYENKSNSNKIINNVKQIWANQEVLIVEGQFSRLGVGNDLFKDAKSIERILCPSESAFDIYNEILEKVIQLGATKLILIALGPTATVLSYDLSKANFWAVDIGHIDVEYMWMLEKATTKTPIKGRYVSESRDKIDFDLPTEYNSEYLKSIVYSFIKEN